MNPIVVFLGLELFTAAVFLWAGIRLTILTAEKAQATGERLGERKGYVAGERAGRSAGRAEGYQQGKDVWAPPRQSNGRFTGKK